MGGEDWQTATVKQLVEEKILGRPIDGNHGEIHPKGDDFVPSGIPFIMASDLANGRVDTTHCSFIREEQARKLRKGFSYPGDVLISHKATMGRTALVDSSNYPFLMLTPQVTYYRVLDSAKLSNRYLKYYFDSPAFQQLFDTWGQKGSTRAYLGITSQLDLPITLPPLREQQAIACILGALDDKIELNRRRNGTLEGLARALFQSWFVDFDPVRAKAEGRAPAGLSKEIAKLFPAALEDSPLGPIPKGWRVQQLPDVLQVNPTRTLRKGTLAPYLDMGNMPTRGPSAETWIQREVGSGMKFVNGDTLVARITPCLENGKTALVDFLAEGEAAWGSTEFIVLRPHGAIPPAFAYLIARDETFRTFAIQQMTGSSGRQRVPAESLSKYEVALPDATNALFASFGRIVTPFFEQITRSTRENATLAALRDALLPKLVSGELRVPDAERIVGRAT